MTSFRGLYPAVITPMDRDDRLNEEAFRQVLEFNIRAGVHGFWVAGGSGESVLLQPEENRRVAEIAADQCRGRARTIMHVGAATTSAAAGMAEQAARAGVDAVCALPGSFYGAGADESIGYYQTIGKAAGLPLFVYNLPDATGLEFTPELMTRLQDEVPQLAGLKHSAANFKNVWIFARMGLACFKGFSCLMLPALVEGAVGCVDGPPGVAPEAFLQVWDAYQEGDWARARKAQDTATEIFGLFDGEYGPYVAVLKELMGRRLGIDCGVPRPPGMPLTPEQADRVWNRFRELMPDA